MGLLLLALGRSSLYDRKQHFEVIFWLIQNCKGCAVTLNLDSRSGVKVKADQYTIFVMTVFFFPLAQSGSDFTKRVPVGKGVQ